MATKVTAQLITYAHALGQRPDKTIPWNHVRGENLFVIVNSTDHGPCTLRLICGNDTMEDLDLASYIDLAMSARDRPGASTLAHLPIFAVTKDSRLSFRYIVREQTCRRLQLHFQDERDCVQVVQLLMRRGMEIRPPEPRPHTAASRPSTAPSSLPRSTKLVPGSDASTSLPSAPYQTSSAQALWNEGAASSHNGLSSRLGQSNKPYQHNASEVPSLMQFDRPSSSTMLTARSRPSSSSLTLPPLPKPTVASDRIALLPDTYAQSENIRSTTYAGHPSGYASAGKPNLMPQLNHVEDDQTARRQPIEYGSAFGHKSGDRSDRIGDGQFNMTTAIETSLLGEYSEQPLADRQAALEEFLIQNLSNPSFVRLCEDVENCWRGLVMRRL